MAARWRRIFGDIVATGSPLAVRTRAGHDLPETNFTDSEAVFLPLGESDDAVDHLLLFAQHERRTSEVPVCRSTSPSYSGYGLPANGVRSRRDDMRLARWWFCSRAFPLLVVRT